MRIVPFPSLTNGSNDPLTAGLIQAFNMACDGKPPRAVAVVYRSLGNQFPAKDWLYDWADRFEAMGDTWK